jgi:hypothetical protein
MLRQTVGYCTTKCHSSLTDGVVMALAGRHR